MGNTHLHTDPVERFAEVAQYIANCTYLQLVDLLHETTCHTKAQRVLMQNIISASIHVDRCLEEVEKF